MTSKTKEYIKTQLIQFKCNLDYIKTLDIDQFTVTRLSLLYAISDSIVKYLS